MCGVIIRTYVHSCKQLTETFGSKRPAPKYLSTVVYCSTSETPSTNTALQQDLSSLPTLCIVHVYLIS